MDRYKKTNLKFTGKGTAVRADQRNAARRAVRQERFSLQRPLDNTEIEVLPKPSKVPTLGIPKLQSRLDMLNKWKAEKELKKRLEMNSKPPVFKVGSARPKLDALGLSRLQESKTESFSSKALTPNRSISKTLKASRIQPVSKLADITHHKNINLRPEAKASGKTIQTSIPSAKPQTVQVNEAKIVPTTKPPQIGKPKVTKVMSLPSTKSATMHPQPSKNLTKNSSAPSNFKPQSNAGMKATKNLCAPSNFKPQSNSGVKESKISNSTKPVAGKSAITKEEKKIQTTGIKPTTLLPQRRTQLQIQQSKSKPVSSVQSKKAVAKAVETPLNREAEVKNPTGSALDQSSSLLSCPLSAIEVSAQEKSFAPLDFVFCPPKIRSSWLDDEGPCTILSRVMKEMKPRTSTPIKKELIEHQEVESSFDKENSMNTGESSSEAKKENSTIPNSDTKYIESLIDSSSAKLSELEKDKKAAIDNKAEDSKSVAEVVSPVKNQGLEPDISSVNKEMGNLVLYEKKNLEPVSDINSPVKPASSDKEKQEPETSPEKEAVVCVASEKNSVESYDENKDCDLKELTDVSYQIVRPCFETINQNEDSTQNVTIEADISVFYPSGPAAVAPQKSKRFFSNCWKMEKPSLALISESPENSEIPQTPKSHRRKGLLAEEFTPRRSLRLARKSELKEENIFEVKECFLDSPSVEAATRMSMRPYDFDSLHLEASASQGKPNGSQSTRTNRGKVSLLYTPPRHRASTRNKSLKGDLITFSPNIE